MQLRLPWSRLSRKLANDMSILCSTAEANTAVLPVGPPKTVSTWTQLITRLVHLSSSVQAYWPCNSPQALQSAGSSVTSTCRSLCLNAFPSPPLIHKLGPSKMWSPLRSLSWSRHGRSGDGWVERDGNNYWNLQTESVLWFISKDGEGGNPWCEIWQYFPSLNHTLKWPRTFEQYRS